MAHRTRWNWDSTVTNDAYRSASRNDIISAIILAVAVFMGWRLVPLALAEHFAHSDPELSKAWRQYEPQALTALAEHHLALDHLPVAADLARRALSANPLAGAAYRVLAQVALRRGDLAEASRLMALALRHDPRDVQARTWLAQQALARRDAPTALAHYDRLLRMLPASQDGIFPILTQLATVPTARESLARILATNPPWRAAWLQQFGATSQDSDAVDATFRAVRNLSRLTLEENAAFIGYFVAHHEWGRAFVAWADSLTPEQRAALRTPVNGTFELERAAPPFDWDISSPDGVDAGIRPLPEGSGHGLRIEFYGRRTPFNNVRQLLWLQPGTYGFKWKSRMSALETARGLRWTVDCVETPGTRLAASAAESGSVPWREYTLYFTVPEGCSAQWLKLELEARIPAETLALGTAWYDDLKIEKTALPIPAHDVTIRQTSEGTRRP